MQRLLKVASLLLATATIPAAAQVTRIASARGEGSLSYLNHFTRASELGELEKRPMGADDIEARAWITQWMPQGVALRRENGQWRAWYMRGVSCGVTLPTAVYDTVSAATRERYLAEARPNCGKPPKAEPTRVGNYAYLGFDTLLVTELSNAVAIEHAWRTAVDSGLLMLPLEVPGDYPTIDGSRYVIEVRRGNEYRVSTIKHTNPPRDEAHRRVQAVFSALASAITEDAQLR
ncbi:MAG: hypothetical protein ACJ8AD_20035 [Gemmatimonadaceae bacterium]